MSSFTRIGSADEEKLNVSLGFNLSTVNIMLQRVLIPSPNKFILCILGMTHHCNAA